MSTFLLSFHPPAVRGQTPGRSIHQSVADGPEARTAVGASVPAAVARRHLGAALPPLVQQELLGDARAHVIPRQLVPLSELPGGLLVDARPGGRKRRLPGILPVHLAPGVEAGSAAPRRLDDVCDLLAAARERPLE